ncbi:hypothetical protein [Streptomyces sp. NPDC001492]
MTTQPAPSTGGALLDTVYSDTATEAYVMEWAGERYGIRPIPAGLDGITAMAGQLGIPTAGLADLDTLAPTLELAARDRERQPQVRTLLRTAAAQLAAAARLVPGEAAHDDALSRARTCMVDAWKVAPGGGGCITAPGGIAQCILCGTQSADLRTQPGAAEYADRAAVDEWYDRHSDLCEPLPRPTCRACLCGGCKAGPSPVHWCDPCTCHRDDD